MNLALIYVRQSRHKDYERTVSPEVQEQACRALSAVAKCDQVEVFTDLDVSGGKRARKAYDAMLAKIKAGGVSVVAAYDQSRAFRSTLLAAEFKALLDEPAYRELDVVYVHGAFDRSPVGGFSYAVLAAAHEMERRMTGEKIKAAYAHLNSNGKATGMPPLGYRRAGDTFEIDEDEAALVRRIFADYASGEFSTWALARRLNEEGVSRPGSRTKHVWIPDSLADVLRNVAYIGKTYTGHRQKRQGRLISASWPALIDEATFDRVQRGLDARRTSRRRSTTAERVFSGLLKCAQCGEPMRVKLDHGATYYHCRRDVLPRCPGPSVREVELLAWAEALMSSVAILGEDGWNATIQEATSRRKTQGRSVEGIDRALERLRKLFTWGDLTDEAYRSDRARLEALRAEALAESAPRSIPPAFKDVAQEWRSADVARRRRVLGRLFEALYVRDRLVIRYDPRPEYADEVDSIMSAIRARGAKYLVPLVPAFGRRLRRYAERERFVSV